MIWNLSFYMKKGLLSLHLILGSFISPAIAEEYNNFYISVGGGVAFPSDVDGDTTLGGTVYDAKFETKNPGILSVGIGKEFNDYRFEFNYSKATVESNKFSLSSGGTGVVASITPNYKADLNNFMLYGYKDFPNESRLTPYGGIGLGTSTISGKEQTVTTGGTNYTLSGINTSVFTLGLKVGASYETAENTSIYTEGTFQSLSSYKQRKEGYVDANFDASSLFTITAGLKFDF